MLQSTFLSTDVFLFVELKFPDTALSLGNWHCPKTIPKQRLEGAECSSQSLWAEYGPTVLEDDLGCPDVGHFLPVGLSFKECLCVHLMRSKMQSVCSANSMKCVDDNLLTCRWRKSNRENRESISTDLEIKVWKYKGGHWDESDHKMTPFMICRTGRRENQDQNGSFQGEGIQRIGR